MTPLTDMNGEASSVRARNCAVHCAAGPDACVGTRPSQWVRHRWASLRADSQQRERGSMALVLAILTVGMLAMAGLVIDGGAALAARGRAADVAQQAARAGADALAPGSVRASGPAGLRIDPAVARAAADRVLLVGEVTGQVSVDGDSVTVRAQVRRPTALLSAVGLSEVSGAASATATVLYGGNQAEPR